MSLGGPRRIGAFKQVRAAGMNDTEADALAVTAFAALAGDPARLQRFMQETGIGPDDLRMAAGSRAVLCAVLEHVLGDESLLLVVATEASVKPEAIGLALQILQKPALGGA